MIHQLTDKAIGVQVPGWSKDWYITNIHADNDLVCPSNHGGVHWIGMLPEGSWKILGLGKDLTPSDKTSIVEKENDGSGHLMSWWYKEYITGAWVKDLHVSFATLLESKGLQGDNTLILIKQ